MPHLLVAGTTGAGKSGAVNAMLSSILLRATPDEVRLVLVDPKQVELNHYEAIPHLLTPVITSPKMAANALQNLVREMEWRYGVMSVKRTRSLVELNKVRVKEGDTALPYILCVIDELADLMMVAPADVEDSIIRLAQKARAVGIHLVLATQSPRVDVITGMIKANVPSRIAFAVSSQTDSRVILDQNGAESLLGQGDMLFSPVGSSRLQRIQGAYIDEPQIETLTGFWARQGEPELREDLLDEVEPEVPDKGGDDDGFDPDEDPLLGDAIQLVVEMGTASTSMLQRRLRLGYTRAGRLIDMLERRGIISGYEGSKPRQVLVTEGDLPRVLAALDAAAPSAPEIPRTPSPQNCLQRSPGPTSPSSLPRPDGGHRGHASRRACASASTSRRSSPRRRSVRSICARWRTRNGTCCRAPPTSRASCARTPRPRAGRQAAHRGVQAPPRAPLRRRDAADPPAGGGPRPAAAPARPGREPRLGRPRRRVRDRRRALLPRQQRGRRRQRRGEHDPVRDDLDHDDPRPDVDDPQVLDDLGPLARRAPAPAGRGPPRPPAASSRPGRSTSACAAPTAGPVVNGRILQAGSRQPTYRSKRFRLLLGNSEARLRINGKTRSVAPTGGILGYEITPPGRVRPLSAGNRPNCGA